MTAGLLLRFPKQILTPAGAGTLSDSGTSLSSTISFRGYLFDLDKWITVGEKRKKRKKRNKKKQRREKITGGLTVGKELEGRLMTSMLEMKKQDTNSAIR